MRYLDSLASPSGVGGSTGPIVQWCGFRRERERGREGGRERAREKREKGEGKTRCKLSWLPQKHLCGSTMPIIHYLVVTLWDLNSLFVPDIILSYDIIINQCLGAPQ